MDRPRAADDFATIRARMEELRREQDGADAESKELRPETAARRGCCDPVFILLARRRKPGRGPVRR